MIYGMISQECGIDDDIRAGNKITNTDHSTPLTPHSRFYFIYTPSIVPTVLLCHEIGHV